MKNKKKKKSIIYNSKNRNKDTKETKKDKRYTERYNKQTKYINYNMKI